MALASVSQSHAPDPVKHIPGLAAAERRENKGLHYRYYMTITANTSSGKPQQLRDTQKQAAIPNRLATPDSSGYNHPLRLEPTQSRHQAMAQILLAHNTAAPVAKPQSRGFLDAFSIPFNLSETESRTPAPQHEEQFLTASG